MIKTPWHSCLGLYLDFSIFTEQMLIPIAIHHTTVAILDIVLLPTWKWLWYICRVFDHFTLWGIRGHLSIAPCWLTAASVLKMEFKRFYNFLFRLLQYPEEVLTSLILHIALINTVNVLNWIQGKYGYRWISYVITLQLSLYLFWASVYAHFITWCAYQQL